MSTRPGVRTGVWVISIALVAAAVALLAVFRLGRGTPAPAQARAPQAPPPIVSAQADTAGEPTAAPARPVARSAPEPEPAPAEPEPAPAAAPALPEPPEREDPIVGYGPPGSGIQVFPPPGTSPPLRGIVVPEDFELPEGYVRHHQVTDDGQDLPAILMFHPDYEEWVDAKGETVEIPADRVVPPELAPPGMPIQMLELPDEAAPDSAP